MTHFSKAHTAFKGAASAAAVLMAGIVCAPSAMAQEVAAFYAGKTLRMVIGYPPGGSNDIYARIVAKNIGRFIPGSPNVVPQNMPGAGSLVAANYMFNSAPKDGTVLGAVSQGIPLESKIGQQEVHYQPSQFNWIGRASPSVSVTMVWKTSKAQTFEDALKNEILLGATGAGSTVVLYPNIMNEVLKTKFKLVMGYKGSAESMLAMQRGEVEGHSTTWEALVAVHSDWVKNGDVRILVQHALNRSSELPNVPTSVELAKNDEDRAVMRLIMSTAEVGKAYFTAPGVPADRVEALRRAFDKMAASPEFIKDIEQVHGEVGAMKGEDLQALIGELDTASPALIARAKAIYN
jgi:tripartite-type tricarboxylate transporter receptor subunit TctC